MTQSILLIGKIALVFIIIYIIVVSLYMLFTILESSIFNICNCLRYCLNQFFYKKATIVPLELATITEEPINSIAIQIYTAKVSII